MRPIPPIRGKWPKAKRGRGHPPLLKSTILGVGAGVLTGPPMTHQPLRLHAPGALSSSSRMAFFQNPSQRQRRGTEGNPLPCPRRMRGTVSREASPVTGSGVGDWSAGAPRSQTPAIFGSFHRWKEHKNGVPPPRRRVPLPTAAKEPKRRFLRPLRQKSFFRRANPEWHSPLLSGHWALAWRRIGPAAPTGAAWPVPCCLAWLWTTGR